MIAKCLPAIAVLMAPFASAQEAGSVTRGATQAVLACSSCHAIAAGERDSPVRKAPAFENVADTPGMTAMALSVWLHTSHPTMPNLIIDGRDTDDLSAYILSLSRRP